MKKYSLCSIDELNTLQTKGINVPHPTMGPISIMVIKQGTDFYAYINKCPHRDVKLASHQEDFFDESGTFIQCSEHGALFLPKTGECITGPCQFQSLETVAITIENEAIFCDLEALSNEDSP
ncbi:Rieske 2Fe-2S domain-containing protein [Marinomonas sp. 15G1-11]|uniref:Rieske 2Fe-2S domain-containing protein n=1 Tax=Marinomonas phaeophyticola TaxID=3004091 RepID=A0ABT4JTM3_9GAMM|nr:Rieske 2Fe-2S domain-containing protein [Marinomonas sp. 15G1-11]MCZ2721663.1 Rieske 2Fe-2S domain-containing protein [Marinomonas sp. 15G1-11]